MPAEPFPLGLGAAGVSTSVVMPRKSPAGRDVLVAYTVPTAVDVAAVLQASTPSRPMACPALLCHLVPVLFILFR